MGQMGAQQAASVESDVLPRAFGRYMLFDRIGRGGMADIYLARAKTQLGGARLAVVKQILPIYSGDSEFGGMLIEEAKLAARLSHANIVQVFDLGREEGRLYIAMEYVEGYDLHQLLGALSRSRVALPAEFAMLIACEVVRALDYAHRARDEEGRALHLVHRDVSPSNVLVSFEGEVKLCDFGIARALRASAARSTDESVVRRSRRVIGKSAYMAPEQARGEPSDARADIFSAGIILWELCAGRRLYRGTEEEMLELAKAGNVPPLPDRGLPSQTMLQAVLDKALAPDVRDRYAASGAMLRDLEDYVTHAGLRASPLRLGAFLTEHFATDIVRARRSRERAATALEKGPPVVLTPIGMPPAAPGERSSPATLSSSGVRDVHSERTQVAHTGTARASSALWVSVGLGLLGMFAAALYWLLSS